MRLCWFWISGAVGFSLFLTATAVITYSGHRTGIQENQCYIPTYTVLTVPIPGHVNVIRNDTGVFLTGLIVDILHELGKVANFKFTLTVAEDSNFGRMVGDVGNVPCFNGAVGSLQAQAFDILAGSMDNVLEYTRAVDFTTPIFRSDVQVLYNTLTGLARANYAVIANTATRDFLATSPDSRLQVIWQNILRNAPASLPATYEAAIALVNQGGWALVGRTPTIDQSVCTSNGLLAKDPQILKKTYAALAVQKDSNLLNRLNLAILTLQEDRTIDSLIRKWFPCTDPNCAV